MNLSILSKCATFGAALVVALALPADAAPPAPARNGQSGQWASPQVLWEQTCARCHTTGVGPARRGRARPQEYVVSVVRNGMLAMPAFPHSAIDDASLSDIARFVSTSRLPKPAAKH